MKRFLIIISIVLLIIAFYAIVSMLRSSGLEKQRQQEAILSENKYQEGIKQISEGRFGDAMTSLSRAALSNYNGCSPAWFE
jgi:Flp pilus assembly protein TadD